MAILRIQALWSNFTGAPGYSNFHFSTDTPNATAAGAAQTAVRNFFNNLTTLLPTGLNIVNSGVANVYDVSGSKTGEVPYTPGAALVGSSAVAYAGGTGAVVHWKTGFYQSGRQLVGKTYIVPLAGGYQSDGTLLTTAQTTILNGANLLRTVTAPQFVVWAPGGTLKPSVSAPAVVAAVPDRTATMRSRR